MVKRKRKNTQKNTESKGHKIHRSTNSRTKSAKTVAKKLLPFTDTFASINFVQRTKSDCAIEENEFQFIVATAIQTLHGEFANQVNLLSFKSIDERNYSAIICFKTEHFTRVLTSLLLFGQWKSADCRFDIVKTAPTPCFLTL